MTINGDKPFYLEYRSDPIAAASERSWCTMRLLREPLIHFLFLGVLLFILYAITHHRNQQPEEAISVSAARIALLVEQWAQQAGRPPTPQELQWLIEQYIREEVLYREAKALGLDRDDVIVRRRLAQKMEFLAADMVTLAEPGEKELADFFSAHLEQYREPVRLSFTHIYFNPDVRSDHIQRDAERTLSSLREQTPPPLRAPQLGDRFMLSRDYTQHTQAEIGRAFGRAFADRLFALPLDEWQGPIESGYGLHLVRIVERSESTIPALSAVRTKVKDDLIAQMRRAANETAYQRLRERYKIIVAPNPARMASSQGVRP